MPDHLDRQIADLPRGQHVCLVYADVAEQMRVVVPFLRAGLGHGERCTYVAADRPGDEVREALASAGIDVAGEREWGALEILTVRDFPPARESAPEGMVEALCTVLERAGGARFSGQRIAAEMSWAVEAEITADRLARFEARLDDLAARTEVTILCQYNRGQMSPAALRGALRTHPLVIVHDRVCPNPYREPPGHVVGDRAEAERVDWMLEQIERASISEAERVQLARELAARAAAEAAEERYRTLFERAADPVLVTDGEGILIEVNAAAVELLGYARDELVGRRLSDLGVPAPGPEWVATEWARLRREGAWSGEFEVRTKDGRLVPIDARVAKIELPTGIVFRGAWRDVSERRRYERLQREFIALVTEELRTPLEMVKGYARAMHRTQRFSATGVEAIVRQAGLLDRLVGDLLDSARIEAGRLDLRREPTDLVALARSQTEQASRLSRAHAVRLEAPVGPLVGSWDAQRLEQVIQNLLLSSARFSPKGGEVVVRVEAVDDDARVTVRVPEPGIPTRELPRLFEPFHRAKGTAGTTARARGLYVTRGLVEAHGGRMWAEAGSGRSAFVFTLPRGRASEQAEDQTNLTPRQFEVAALIAQGKSNREIADELVLARGTVANHVEHILRRTGLRNRAQISSWAAERGLLR